MANININKMKKNFDLSLYDYTKVPMVGVHNLGNVQKMQNCQQLLKSKMLSLQSKYLDSVLNKKRRANFEYPWSKQQEDWLRKHRSKLAKLSDPLGQLLNLEVKGYLQQHAKMLKGKNKEPYDIEYDTSDDVWNRFWNKVPQTEEPAVQWTQLRRPQLQAIEDFVKEQQAGNVMHTMPKKGMAKALEKNKQHRQQRTQISRSQQDFNLMTKPAVGLVRADKDRKFNNLKGNDAVSKPKQYNPNVEVKSRMIEGAQNCYEPVETRKKRKRRIAYPVMSFLRSLN